MKKLRLVSLLLALLAGILAFLFSPFHGEPWPFGLGFCLAFASLCLLCLWFAARGHIHRDRLLMAWSALSGIVFGGVGVVAGMVGSMLLWPQSNLAPILGIFETGPLAFAGGVLDRCDHASYFPAVSFLLLMRKGADLRDSKYHQMAAIHMAAMTPSSLDVLRFLADAGADVNAADWRGRTPLDCAYTWNTSAVPVLLHYGARLGTSDWLRSVNITPNHGGVLDGDPLHDSPAAHP